MTVREPLVHLSKRDAMHPLKALAIRAAAFVLGMLTCGTVAFLLIDDLEFSSLGEFYQCFIDGVMKNDRQKWTFFTNTAVLLCISLALTPAFKMRFWNTGAEGQVLVGVLAAIGTRFYLGAPYVARHYVAEPWLLLPMLGASLLAGAVWALIPALFKARWGTNETLFTLMMNYVAANLVTFFLMLWVPGGSMKITINNDFPTVFTALDTNEKTNFKYNTYLLIILAVLLLTILIYVYLNYSKHGYEISVVGESLRTAQYVGINVSKVIIRTMLLSGLMCGLAGFLIGAGLDNTVTSESVGGQGFTGIMVAWLAKFNPMTMILTSGIITFLNLGASQISTVFGVSGSLPNVLIGIVLFFIIGSEFFINYKPRISSRRRLLRILFPVFTLLFQLTSWYGCRAYYSGKSGIEYAAKAFGPYSGLKLSVPGAEYSMNLTDLSFLLTAAKIVLLAGLIALAVFLVCRLLSARGKVRAKKLCRISLRCYYLAVLLAAVLGLFGILTAPGKMLSFRLTAGWLLTAVFALAGCTEAFMPETVNEEVSK